MKEEGKFYCDASKVYVAPIAKSIAKDIIVKKQDTGMAPGPIVGDLNSIGIPAKIMKGSVHIQKDTVAIKEGETFEEVIDDYWHTNESGKTQELHDILDKSSFEKILDDNGGDLEAAAQEFAAFPNTQAFFTQARGFSKDIEGAPQDFMPVISSSCFPIFL